MLSSIYRLGTGGGPGLPGTRGGGPGGARDEGGGGPGGARDEGGNLGGGGSAGLLSSLVGVEAPLPPSLSSVSESDDSDDSDSDSSSSFVSSSSLVGECLLVFSRMVTRPLSTDPRGARSMSGMSGSTGGSGGLVGAGVASPEAVARLSEDRDSGMSVSRSGSGGAENRSENPPPDLASCGSSFFASSFSAGAGSGFVSGSGD